MANTPTTVIRVEPELIRDAAAAAGLGGNAPATNVIRFALAVLAGRSNPHAVAMTKRGPKPKTGAAA